MKGFCGNPGKSALSESPQKLRATRKEHERYSLNWILFLRHSLWIYCMRCGLIRKRPRRHFEHRVDPRGVVHPNGSVDFYRFSQIKLQNRQRLRAANIHISARNPCNYLGENLYHKRAQGTKSIRITDLELELAIERFLAPVLPRTARVGTGEVLLANQGTGVNLAKENL